MATSPKPLEYEAPSDRRRSKWVWAGVVVAILLVVAALVVVA